MGPWQLVVVAILVTIPYFMFASTLHLRDVPFHMHPGGLMHGDAAAAQKPIDLSGSVLPLPASGAPP